MSMSPRFARPQRGISLIEIILVCAIVAVATVSIFVFAKKASVSAAVETEQRQVEDIVKTVEGLFATRPNFASLGTNGADAATFLQTNAARAGLSLTQDGAGNAALRTGLGGGDGTLSLAATQVSYPSDPGQPNNGFVLTYQGLTPAECISLTTSTASFTTKTLVGTGGTLPTDEATARMSLRGQLIEDKAQLSSLCNPADAKPSVFLVFAPARAIAAVAPPTAPAAARCEPVHEVQQTACPAGQVGTITQERDGACTGAGNSMVYTAWATTDDTCQDAATAPPTVTPPSNPDNCTTSTFTQALACPAGETGQITQTRSLDSCAGTYTPWATTSTSCAPAGPAATCVPATASQTIACPAGQGGAVVQERSSTCASPASLPTWSAWQTISNTCSASCVAAGTCCNVQRQIQTTADPCPAGTYGASGQDQERFLGCDTDTIQSAAWGAWQTLTSTGSCTACPATSTETNIQWDVRTDVCPAGQTGNIQYEAEQVRTRDASYSCPAGTATLPSPSYTAWGGWADTGATRNVVNNCVAGCATGVKWVSVGQGFHGVGVVIPPYQSDQPWPTPLATLHPSMPASMVSAAAAAKSSAVVTLPPTMFDSSTISESGQGLQCATAGDAGNVRYKYERGESSGIGMSGGFTYITTFENYEVCMSACDESIYEPGVCATTNAPFYSPHPREFGLQPFVQNSTASCPAPLTGSKDTAIRASCVDKNSPSAYWSEPFTVRSSCSGTIHGRTAVPEPDWNTVCGGKGFPAPLYRDANTFYGGTCGTDGFLFFNSFGTQCAECPALAWMSTSVSTAPGVCSGASNYVRRQCLGFDQTTTSANPFLDNPAWFTAADAACVCDATHTGHVLTENACFEGTDTTTLYTCE